MMRSAIFAISSFLFLLDATPASAQQRCDIPHEARDIWHCENGFVIGPENVIIRLPIPETDPEALYNAGVEAAQREDWRVAIAYFTAAHQRAHLVPRYMYNLGLAHARAGHEVAAIAWLTAYLIAEPAAPNRAAIWSQIRQLESATHSRSATVFDAAAAAAAELPRVAVDRADRIGARATAYFSMASTAAFIGDFDLARRFATSGQSASLDPSYNSGTNFLDSSGHDLKKRALEGAIFDGDMVGATALVNEIGPPESWDEPEFSAWTALQRTGVSADICQTFLMQRFQTFACPNFPYYLPEANRTFESAVRSGDRARILAARRAMGLDASRDAISLALQGQLSRAAALVAATDAGFENNGPEGMAAIVAEVLMRTGSRGADQFVEAAQRSVQRVRMLDGATVDNVSSGWFAARAQAFLLIEQEHVQEAVDELELYTTRRLGSWPPMETPESAYLQGRFDALVTVAQYLIDRGRGADASPLVEKLDSLRQTRAAETYPNLFQPPATVQSNGTRRQFVENAVVVAIGLPTVCYDLDWELHAIAMGRGVYETAGWGPQGRVGRLAAAAAGLERGLRRIRAGYAYAGGTWGQ